MENLLIDPKPKYLPLYEKTILPSKSIIIPTPTITTNTSFPEPIKTEPIKTEIIETTNIPKKSFLSSLSYNMIIGIVVLVCFVFYTIYYNYKSDKNKKNYILPIYTKQYKVTLDEMKDDAKKFIKNTVDTLSSYKDYIMNLSRQYFYGMQIEKGTLRTSAPKKPQSTPSSSTKKPTEVPSTPSSVTATPVPISTIKSDPAKTSAPTTLTKEASREQNKNKM